MQKNRFVFNVCLLILSMLFISSSLSAATITLVSSYTAWKSLDEVELNFNTISNNTYITNQFINQGVLFGNYNGSTYVSTSRLGSDLVGYNQIDYGSGEWQEITFVVPGTTTPYYALGFGLKFNTPDSYNWVEFYDRQGNLLATYTAAGNAISATENYFLGATYADGIGKVRVGSSNIAFETYNYEAIIFVPEPSSIAIALFGIGLLAWRRK